MDYKELIDILREAQYRAYHLNPSPLNLRIARYITRELRELQYCSGGNCIESKFDSRELWN